MAAVNLEQPGQPRVNPLRHRDAARLPVLRVFRTDADRPSREVNILAPGERQQFVSPQTGVRGDDDHVPNLRSWISAGFKQRHLFAEGRDALTRRFVLLLNERRASVVRLEGTARKFSV